MAYFRTYYISDDDRESQWAPYARINAPFNTNMALERFHRHLKQNYLLKSENRRLDFTIASLLRAATASSHSCVVNTARNNVLFRQGLTHNRHRRAVDSYAQNLHKIEKVPDQPVWVVKSRTIDDKFYAVHFVQECQCAIDTKCRYCSVCFDEFQCDCPDSVKSGFACAHIHAVQLKIQSEPNTNPRRVSNTSCDIRAADTLPASVSTAEITEPSSSSIPPVEDTIDDEIQIIESAEPALTPPTSITVSNWRTECIAMLQVISVAKVGQINFQYSQFW